MGNHQEISQGENSGCSLWYHQYTSAWRCMRLNWPGAFSYRSQIRSAYWRARERQIQNMQRWTNLCTLMKPEFQRAEICQKGCSTWMAIISVNDRMYRQIQEYGLSHTLTWRLETTYACLRSGDVQHLLANWPEGNSCELEWSEDERRWMPYVPSHCSQRC